MKYNQATNKPDGKAWKVEIENEHDHMAKNDVSEVVKKADLKPGSKVIDSTWVCKKRSNETLR